MLSKLKVLFLCTGNSCRSQMAEGWTRHLLGSRIDSYSAGVDPGRLDPRAVAVMAEVGVDISSHHAKGLKEVQSETFDLVVTVCDEADKSCPVFPGRVKVVRQPFDDPPRLASAASSDQEALEYYRRVRDEIRAFIEELPQLASGAAARGGTVS